MMIFPMPITYSNVSATAFRSAIFGLALLGCLAIQFNVSAQEVGTGTDARIAAAYGQEYVERLEQESPNHLAYLTFVLDNGYFLMDHPEKPGAGIALVSEVSKNDRFTASSEIAPPDPNNLTSFNVLLYNFARERNRRTVYLIDGTGKALVFYSSDELAQMYNEHQSGGNE